MDERGRSSLAAARGSLGLAACLPRLDQNSHTSLIGVKAIFSSRRRNSAFLARSDATVLFTGTIQDIGKLQGRKYERQDQPDH
jgi:hypothetical protein